MNFHELRTRLDEVTSTKKNQDSHPNLVAAIPGCTARAIAEGDARLPKAATYNCFMYALGLSDSEDYRILTAQFTRLGADANFIQYLIQNRVLHEIPRESGVTNDIVVYSDTAGPQHAGRLFGMRVVSKWGSGLLWEHAILEVPINYGESLRFYRQLSLEAAESAFAAYVGTTLQCGPEQVERLLKQRRSPVGAPARAEIELSTDIEAAIVEIANA